MKWVHIFTDMRMYLRWSLCILYLHVCQLRVAIGILVFVVVLVLHILSAN